ncbi:MAG: flagellar protein FlgN [Candidatus Kapabacteria bacterium]|jgi:hypothetical protein|nr:flagellar protein FlgN [Candidatus Kapabacteria bacterium]
MLAKLHSFLKFEKDLIDKLTKLAEEQRDALVKFDMIKVEQLAIYQDDLVKKIREAEEKRIKLLMNWMGISRMEAVNLKLSSIERRLEGAQMLEIKRLRIALKKLVSNLQNLNNTNRVLANRAKSSIQNMMMMFVGGGHQMFNVKI